MRGLAATTGWQLPLGPPNRNTLVCLRKLTSTPRLQESSLNYPGSLRTCAYRIVNHRDRHGFFTHWKELAEVKEFPMDDLDKIKQHATLERPPDIDPGEFHGPRRVKPAHLQREKKKPKGYTKSIRSTRRQDRMKAG